LLLFQLPFFLPQLLMQSLRVGACHGPLGFSDLALDPPGLVTLESALEALPRTHVIIDYHQENGYGQDDASDGEYLVEVSNVVIPIGPIDSHSIAPVVRC